MKRFEKSVHKIFVEAPKKFYGYSLERGSKRFEWGSALMGGCGGFTLAEIFPGYHLRVGVESLANMTGLDPQVSYGLGYVTQFGIGALAGYHTGMWWGYDSPYRKNEPSK